MSHSESISQSSDRDYGIAYIVTCYRQNIAYCKVKLGLQFDVLELGGFFGTPKNPLVTGLKRPTTLRCPERRAQPIKQCCGHDAQAASWWRC